MSEGRFICLGVGGVKGTVRVSYISGVKGTVRVSYISYRKHCFEKVTYFSEQRFY